MSGPMRDTEGGVGTEDVPPMVRPLRIVARISLLVSVIAGCGILLTILIIVSGAKTGGYFEAIQTLSVMRMKLLPSMVLCGLILVGVAGLMTWLITLYSSFRVAGPLFRFSRNVEMEILDGPCATVTIRRDDQLQDNYAEIERTVLSLERYYGEVLSQVDEISFAMGDSEQDNSQAIARSIRRLKSPLIPDG